jgi:hypothetical protein
VTIISVGPSARRPASDRGDDVEVLTTCARGAIT